MRIINTIKNPKSKIQNPKSQTNPKFQFSSSKNISSFGFRSSDYCCLLVSLFLAFSVLCGCIQKSELNQAQNFVSQSEAYYQRAIALYKDLIAQGKDPDRLYLELGKLYYNHGGFIQAIEEFKKTNDFQAKKFLAISYYKSGNFTDALEVFSKSDSSDDEYLYYYGLTCEKLNLFDQALSVYRRIKAKEFAQIASEHINTIEKQVNLAYIKDISPQANKILTEAPSEDKYPQAGVLILYCDEKIEITPQNTQVSYLHYIIKILNERGKEAFSEIHIDYDSTYEKVELEYARTIKPDGTIAEVGSRHIRDVSEYLNFPLYSNARVYIISFPDLVEGASIEYKLKIYRHQLINKKDYITSYPVQASEPIIAENFSIELPKDKVLNIKALNDKYNDFGANLKPQIQPQDDRITYSWQFKDIPQIIPESNMPSGTQINPVILISTFSNWQDIYNWWWALAKDKIKADAAIKDKVNQLTKDLVSEEAKIRAVYNFCAQKIRYVAVEYGQAGYEPHNASDIFRYKYGDCKDQAILLVTMLKEAGLTAWPVLISTKEYYNLNADFPSVFFNHCIAAVSLKDKIVFLDPTAQTCAFGDLPGDDQARKVLIFKEDGYEIQDTPLYLSQHNLIRQSLNIKVNPDETISAKKDIFSYGIYDQAQRFWLLYTQPELIEQTLKEKIQETSIGATLQSYDIKNLGDLNTPVILNYEFKGPEYFTVAGSLRIMPQLAGTDVALVAQDKRKYPIDFAILDTKETVLEIEIPDNFFIKYLPQNLTQESPWLNFKVEYNYKNNKLYFRQSSELKRTTILENEYPEFKNFFEDLAKKIKQRIVLEKKE
jgi:transglutaminase-like putative cysteine protease